MAERVVLESSLRRSSELSNLRFALIVSIPVLLFLLLVVAYPLAYALYLSFNQIQFFGGYSAEWAGFTNYVNVVKDGDFWSSLWLTLLFTVETVILTLAVGMALALILKRLPQGWRWLRALIILPWAVSPYGAGIFFGYLAGADWRGHGACEHVWLERHRSISSRPSSSCRIWRSERRGTWPRSWRSSFSPTC